MASTAKVVVGPESIVSESLVCKSVADVRYEWEDQLNIGTDMRAFINGREANDTAILAAGDELVFMAPAGTKG
jgi:hypothetical protein